MPGARRAARSAHGGVVLKPEHPGTRAPLRPPIAAHAARAEKWVVGGRLRGPQSVGCSVTAPAPALSLGPWRSDGRPAAFEPQSALCAPSEMTCDMRHATGDGRWRQQAWAPGPGAGEWRAHLSCERAGISRDNDLAGRQTGRSRAGASEKRLVGPAPAALAATGSGSRAGAERSGARAASCFAPGKAAMCSATCLLVATGVYCAMGDEAGARSGRTGAPGCLG